MIPVFEPLDAAPVIKALPGRVRIFIEFQFHHGKATDAPFRVTRKAQNVDDAARGLREAGPEKAGTCG